MNEGKAPDTVHVRLNGRDLVWLKNLDGGGPLAYPEHVDADGNVKLEHVFSDSYAQVGVDGLIRRHHQVIGQVGDLEVYNG
jgi:hypothetical protein